MRANERLFIDNQPEGVMPPWFVLGWNSGQYAAYDRALGVIPFAFTNNSFEAGAEYVHLTNPILSGDAGATIVSLGVWMGLGNHTLRLGSNGAGGLRLHGYSNISASGDGHIDIGTNTLYIYTPHDGATIDAPIVGTGEIRKFGPSFAGFGSSTIPSAMAVQEGTIMFAPSESFIYSGKIYGAGEFNKRAAATLTLEGNDTPLDVFHATIEGGALRVMQGDSRLEGNFYLSTGAVFEIANAAVVSHGNSWWDSEANGELIVGAAGHLSAKGVSVGNKNGGAVARVDNGSLTVSGTLTVGGGFNGSLVEAGAGAVIAANSIIIGSNGSGNTVRINAGASLDVAQDITAGVGSGVDNALALAGGEISARNLAVAAGNALAVELQSNGIAPAQFSGAATFAANACLRPSIGGDVIYGMFKILSAADGVAIADDELRIDVAPDHVARWSCRVIGNDLYLLHKPQHTLLLVR